MQLAVVDDVMLHRAGGLVRATRELADAAFRLQTLLESVDLKIAVSKSRAPADLPAAGRALEEKLRRPFGGQVSSRRAELGRRLRLRTPRPEKRRGK